MEVSIDSGMKIWKYEFMKVWKYQLMNVWMHG